MGNLPWDVAATTLEGVLADAAAALLGPGAVEYARVCTFEMQRARKRDRDLGKIHHGHAWLKFATRPQAEAALANLGTDSRLQFASMERPLLLDWAREKDAAVPPPPTEEELAEQRKRQREAAERNAHKKRQRKRRQEKRLELIKGKLGRLTKPGGLDVQASFTKMEAIAARDLDWEGMPYECHPGKIGLEYTWGGEKCVAGRARRKVLQVESFATILKRLLTEATARSRIVDFGSGSGALTLPLAWLFPAAHFVAVDMKAQAVGLALEKAKKAKVTNISGAVTMIELYQEPFDVALALHACGNATDHAMLQAIKNRAAFIVCPCCIGKLKYSVHGGSSFSAEHRTYQASQGEKDGLAEQCPEITHPRSRWMGAHVDAQEFAIMAKFADISHGQQQEAGLTGEEHPFAAEARVCKANLECDRSEFAREAGYRVALLNLYDSHETAKAQVLVGVPPPGGKPFARSLLTAEGADVMRE